MKVPSRSLDPSTPVLTMAVSVGLLEPLTVSQPLLAGSCSGYCTETVKRNDALGVSATVNPWSAGEGEPGL